MRSINIITVLSASLLIAPAALASDLGETQNESANQSSAVDSDQTHATVIGDCGGTIVLDAKAIDKQPQPLPDGEGPARPAPLPSPGFGNQAGDPTRVFGDLDGDGIVGASDLLILMSQWGNNYEVDKDPASYSADLNHDGFVMHEDLALLMRFWTT